MKNLPLVLGGLLAAVAASSCCVLPLLLGVAGAGTLGAGAALAPYRPYLIGLTALLLGGAFYLAYRPGGSTACATTTGCCPPATDAANKSRQAGRLGLWCVAATTVAVTVYPWIAGLRVAGAAAATPVQSAVAVKASVAVFAIGNMTCAECTGGIADALRKTPGVYGAEVDFDTKRATVRYDAARIGAAGLREAIGRTGFPATQVPAP